MFYSALVNLVIGSVAVISGPASEPLPASDQVGYNLTSQTCASEGGFLLRWGCVIVALTGGVSMGWRCSPLARCLIFGASLQVFALVLMAFILGIGFGSGIVASPRLKHLRGVVPTIFLLLGAAVYLCFVVFKFENLAMIFLSAPERAELQPHGLRLSASFGRVVQFAPWACRQDCLGQWCCRYGFGRFRRHRPCSATALGAC